MIIELSGVTAMSDAVKSNLVAKIHSFIRFQQAGGFVCGNESLDSDDVGIFSEKILEGYIYDREFKIGRWKVREIENLLSFQVKYFSEKVGNA